MTRIKQFANDMGLSYNQAKNLVNKGRKKRDGGSSVLERTMNKVKPVKAAEGKITKINGGKKAMMAQVKNFGKLAREGKISVDEAVKQIDLIQDKLLGKKKAYGGVNKVKPVYAKEGKSMKLPKKRPKLPKKKPKNFKKIVEDQRLARGEITIGDLNEANTNPKDFMPDKMLEKQTGGGFGMLSVKAGIDNNPKPTQADRIAGATMKDKKEVKKMGGGMYDMTPRRMNKGGVARGMGAAVKGTGFKGVY